MQVHPCVVLFTGNTDVRDEVCDYVNKNDVDIVIVGRRSLESAQMNLSLRDVTP